ncbi:MAG: YncE family protein [candidate division WOR-3 bacterium]|nr:YncE family protein [candidate division WOR-3 bacterium]
MKRILLKIVLLIIWLVYINCQKNRPPGIPDTPSGPKFGRINITYQFVSSALDMEDERIAIRFDWGDGDTSDWSKFVPLGETVSMSHAWKTSDTFEVRAQAKDLKENKSVWSDKAVIYISSNRIPRTPFILTGPSSSFVNVFNDYTTLTLDADGDSIAYQFDWGDGTLSEWSNFMPCSIPVTMRKVWVTPGVYYIKSRAKDTKGEMSDWSYEYQVRINLTGCNFPNYVVGTISLGNNSNPEGIAALPNNNYVYVANYGNDSISVIQTSNNSVIGKFYVGENPYGLCVHPNGQYLYVTTKDDVTVIRTLDNLIVGQIPISQSPRNISILPNGEYIYVTRIDADSVAVIQTATNSVITSIPVGDMPWDVTPSANGEYVYVTNAGSNNISKIQVSTNTVIDVIPFARSPRAIVTHPNCQYLYVTDDRNSVSVISTLDNTVIATIRVGDNPTDVKVLDNGEYVYVVNQSENTVSVIRTLNNKLVALIPVGISPSKIAVLSNGTSVYVTNSIDNTVSVISR